MMFVKENSVVGIQIVNLISWTISMLFIFFVDKLFVPDLVNENNSKELHKFILIRLLSLIIEVMILFIFASVIRFDYYKVKLISLVLLFFFNHFYVSHVKFN
jgi:putative flippase GtrA